MVGSWHEFIPLNQMATSPFHCSRKCPPVIACSEDNDLDVSASGGFSCFLRDILSLRMQAFIQRYGTLIASQSQDIPPLFHPKHLKQHAIFTMKSQAFQSVLETEFQRSTQVGPLLTSTWNQRGPYNGNCPMGDGGRTVTGCLATAVAQILNYHEWPSSGTGTFTYHWDGDQSCGGSVGGGNLTANFNDPYDWLRMPDNCSGGCTDLQKAALAEVEL